MSNSTTTLITIDSLRDNIGNEYTFTYSDGKKEIFTMTEYLAGEFANDDELLKSITPNF